MLNFKKIENNCVLIETSDSFNRFLNVLKTSLGYFSNRSNISVPDFKLPYNSESVLPPNNYLLIKLVSKNFDANKFQAIVDLAIEFKLVVAENLLISKDWIQYDEHKIIKQDGEINYIFIKNKLYKVFEKNITTADLINLNDIIPNSWLWQFEI